MAQRATLVLGSALLLLPGAATAGESFPSVEAAGVWLMSYYQHPQPERLPELLDAWGQHVRSDSLETVPPVAQFIAEVIRREPTSCAESLYRAGKRNGNWQTKNLALEALWHADTDTSRRLLRQAASEWKDHQLAEEAGDMLRNPPRRLAEIGGAPGSQDRWWTAFYATGERQWVEQVAKDPFDGRPLP